MNIFYAYVLIIHFMSLLLYSIKVKGCLINEMD